MDGVPGGSQQSGGDLEAISCRGCGWWIWEGWHQENQWGQCLYHTGAIGTSHSFIHIVDARASRIQTHCDFACPMFLLPDEVPRFVSCVDVHSASGSESTESAGPASGSPPEPSSCSNSP